MEVQTLLAKYCNKPLWFLFLSLCVLAFLSHRPSFLFYSKPFVTNVPKEIHTDQSSTRNFDQCVGRYIFIHDLPGKFNVDILKNCSAFKWSKKCDFLSNSGLGLKTEDSGGILQKNNWYATYQFGLEVIFHNRMKRYKCLTNDSALASAIFVPFYAGFDLVRYLRDDLVSDRVDSNSIELMKWLTAKGEWKRMQGGDHFFVAARTTWDFRRRSDNHSKWGNILFELPESKNMTILGIESQRWSKNEHAIPYPTYFHPTHDAEIFQWQSKIEKVKRPYLYSFVGASRPKFEKSIRSMIINQCILSGGNCNFFNCRIKNCKNPVNVMKMLQKSNFCLQPAGDTATRRSTFDSILAGCIPVFFNPKSAYTQYKWHLPKNYSKYSVYIPETKVRQGPESIEMILKGISNGQVRSMRKQVIKLIPRIIYADPRSSLDTLEDAFDIAIRGAIARVDRIKKEAKDGRNNVDVSSLG